MEGNGASSKSAVNRQLRLVAVKQMVIANETYNSAESIGDQGAGTIGQGLTWHISAIADAKMY